MKIRSKYPLMLTIGLASCLMGCTNAVYDDLSACPQNLDFHFLEHSPCSIGNNYPEAVKQLRVFAFNEENKLIHTSTVNGVTPSESYFLPTEMKASENITFVAWAANDFAGYNLTQPSTLQTSAEQLFLALKEKGEQQEKGRLYTAMKKKYMDGAKAAKEGSSSDTIYFNLKEITNRIHLTVQGLNSQKTYIAEVKDPVGQYNFLGEAMPNGVYAHQTSLTPTNDSVKTSFTLLGLSEHSADKLVITEKESHKTVYEGYLVKDLILKAMNQGAPYNLECDHDFNIVLKLKQSGETWMLITATINGWNLVIREDDLG